MVASSLTILLFVNLLVGGILFSQKTNISLCGSHNTPKVFTDGSSPLSSDFISATLPSGKTSAQTLELFDNRFLACIPAISHSFDCYW